YALGDDKERATVLCSPGQRNTAEPSSWWVRGWFRAIPVGPRGRSADRSTRERRARDIGGNRWVQGLFHGCRGVGQGRSVIITMIVFGAPTTPHRAVSGARQRGFCSCSPRSPQHCWC